MQAAIYHISHRTCWYLAFGHGFNIHFGQIVPPANINVFMVAPKGPDTWFGREYERSGVPCLLAVHQDQAGRRGRLAMQGGRRAVQAS